MPRGKSTNGSKTQPLSKRNNRSKPQSAIADFLDYSLTSEKGLGLPKTAVPFIDQYITAIWAQVDTALSEISIALVGDATMSRLHQDFMGIPGPTDVLTFELDHDAAGTCTAGEIVICVPEARRRCVDHGVSLDRELLLYALHGMLHLAGLDDRTDKAFEAMHRTEDQILSAIGVGPVFAAAGSSRAAQANPYAGSHAIAVGTMTFDAPKIATASSRSKPARRAIASPARDKTASRGKSSASSRGRKQ